jgi:hypothetical protein
MLDWSVSSPGGTAFLDLRYEALEDKDATRLVDALIPYYARRQISRVVIAVPEDASVSVRVLAHALKLQASARGVDFEEQRS